MRLSDIHILHDGTYLPLFSLLAATTDEKFNSQKYFQYKNIFSSLIFSLLCSIFPIMAYLEANNLLASDSLMCLLHFPNSSLMGVFGLTASLYLEMKLKTSDE